MLWGGSSSLKCNALKELKSIMIDYNLVDIWRARNPNLRQFTWRSSPIKLRRLDFFLISDDMQYDVRNCTSLLLYKVIIHPSLFVSLLYQRNNLEEGVTGNLIIC